MPNIITLYLIEMSNDKIYDNPLVSIIVITYNSCKTVLETLESTKAQTYKNIELIISDDCSTDHTVDICLKWLKDNSTHFASAELVTVVENSGIPSNCNRGIKASSGKWIKIIAGDDVLLDDAILDFVQFSTSSSSSDLIFADFLYINENSILLNRKTDINKSFFNLEAAEQNKHLLIGSNFMIPALTGFILKKTIVNLDYFDEEITYCEDYPMWIKATGMGYKLSFLDKKVAKYRIHSGSITGHFNKRYHSTMRKVFFKYRLRSLIKYKPAYALELVFYNLFREYEIFNKYSTYLLPSNYITRVKKYFTQ